MKASPLDLQGKGAATTIVHSQPDPFSSLLFSSSKTAKDGPEPRSVLDHIRSPSPPSSSTSTLSSSALAALSDHADPPPSWVPGDLPLLDWDPSLDHSFLKWVSSDLDDPKNSNPQTQTPPFFSDTLHGTFGALDPAFSFDHTNGKGPLLAAGAFLPDEKPQFLANNLLLQQPQNPSFLLPFSPYALADPPPPPAKRLHSAAQDPFFDPPRASLPQSFGGFQSFSFHGLPACDDVAGTAHQQQQQQDLIDQLFKAAELIQGGNSVTAQGILARLNHQLSPVGKPLFRSAFYFKEALDAAAASSSGHCPPLNTPKTPFDVVLKISAYKSFSEISPVMQFANFTCVQMLLEELVGCDHIHVVDFDIGVGGQWSSFMQELWQRRAASGANTAVSLKITAFVSPSSYHALELLLTRDSLMHFASDLGIPFEFNILSVGSFDPAAFSMASRGDEAIVVSIPVGTLYSSTPGLLRCVKQLSPKIVVSLDYSCDRCELPFSQHFLNLLHSYTVLLESIDAAGANLEATNKIERLLLQPRIDNAVLGRYRITDKMLPWRTMFTSAGFAPVHFSNFTETQAECLLKRIQIRGFHVEKRQSSLVLFWQRGELVSISAWRC